MSADVVENALEQLEKFETRVLVISLVKCCRTQVDKLGTSCLHVKELRHVKMWPINRWAIVIKGTWKTSAIAKGVATMEPLFPARHPRRAPPPSRRLQVRPQSFHPPSRCVAQQATWIVSTAFFAVTAPPPVKRHVMGNAARAEMLVCTSPAKCARMEAVKEVCLVHLPKSHGW